MLVISKVTANGAAGYADYLQGKTVAHGLGDYYLKNGERVEAPGRWVRMSAALGPEAQTARVSAETLRSLMAVQIPGSELPLRPIGGNGQAVAAIDATFSAPKSVSAVWALGDTELRHRVEVAHEHAVTRAVGYALEHVQMIRRRVDENTVIHLRAEDVVATSWRHTTARAVDGQVPDPQLHSHVLLHAAKRDDGRLVAIDSRMWMIHQREIGAAYRSELAREMTQLGYSIRRGTGRGGRYFEIDGVPQPLIDKWSSRGHQIEAAIRHRLQDRGSGDLGEAQRWAVMTPAEDRRIRTSTRAPKQLLNTNDLDHAWLSAARQLGIDGSDLVLSCDVRSEAMAAATPAELVEALTEFDAIFRDREGRAVALELGAGADIDDSLQTLHGLRQAGQVLELADGAYTTARHRALEQSVIASAEKINGSPGVPIPEPMVMVSQQRIDALLGERGSSLSDEQRGALVLATGERRLVMIEGQAGTGKSTVLSAVALAHQADERQVIVTSTGALAAQRLARDLHDVGVDAPAYSTTALTHAISRGDQRLNEHSTIIHDEAALASTREQHHLLNAVGQAGARLILIGDPEQSQPVGAGGLWSHLHDRIGEPGRAELTINQRAQDPEDRRDQQLFRQHDHQRAIENYSRRGRVWLADGSYVKQTVVGTLLGSLSRW